MNRNFTLSTLAAIAVLAGCASIGDPNPNPPVMVAQVCAATKPTGAERITVLTKGAAKATGFSGYYTTRAEWRAKTIDGKAVAAERMIESEIVPTTLMVDDLLWDIQSTSKDQWTAWSAASGVASGENFAARTADEQSIRIVSASGKESRYCVRFRTMSLKRYIDGYAEHWTSDVVPTCSCGR